MFTIFKYLFYTFLIAVIFLLLITVLLATITTNGVDDFKNYLVTYPIIFFLPFMLALSYLFMVRFRRSDGWTTDEVPKQSKFFYPVVAGILFIAAGTYYFYLNPNMQLSYTANADVPSKSIATPINYKNNNSQKPRPKTEVLANTATNTDSIVEPMRVATTQQSSSNSTASSDNENVETRYTSRSKAYFYSQANSSSRRQDFIKDWDNAYLPLNALKESNGFIYVNFPTKDGSMKTGWLRKKDLKDVQIVLQKSK